MFDLQEIDSHQKQRLIDFISENNLDYKVIDNGISRFHIVSHDDMKFSFYIHENRFIVVKYNPFTEKFEYLNFTTLPQVLEQLSFHDNSITKNYWVLTLNSAEINFDKENYKDNWFEDFAKDENWTCEEDNLGTYLVYNNTEYRPKIRPYYNTLHEVSTINKEEFTEVDSLNFQIHPISLKEGSETYLFKLRCNNDLRFTDWVNYIVSSKKGLNLLIQSHFTQFENFKISN